MQTFQQPEYSFRALENLFFVPICHYSMEFAQVVRKAILEVRPDVIAVELPESLEEMFKKAVGRLPLLSVILYETAGNTYYLPIEPTDPLCEAVRTAVEMDIELKFIDLDVQGYPSHADLLPDHYAIRKTGYREFVELCVRERNDPPEDRDRFMARNLNRILDSKRKVMTVCGLFHYRPVLQELENPVISLVRPAIKEGICICDLHEDSIREVTSEMPFIMAAYEAWRNPSALAQVKPKKEKKANVISLSDHQSKSAPDLQVAEPLETRPKPGPVKQIDLTALISKILSAVTGKGSLAAEDLDPEIWFPEGLFTARKAKKPKVTVRKFRNSNDRIPEISALLESIGEGFHAGDLDRLGILQELMKQCEAFYTENTGEEFKPWQQKIFRKYSRNCALVTDRLVPSFYDLIVAARGVADDNYAYEVWDLGSFYPWYDEDSKFVKVKLDGDFLWRGTRRVIFRRQYPSPKRVRPVAVKDRKNEESPGDWEEQFTDDFICSYPKEDIVLEKYGDFLKKKTLSNISEQSSKTEPFTTTLLDGLDLRTTLRNWHEKKLYVKETRRTAGGADAVVLIFDEDLDGLKYPWKMTWTGEHNQESDMAFYSTDIYSKIVGPGIARCEHGGFLLVYPPMRMFDVWSDPLYSFARSKPEILLLAALDYSLEKHVIYVAARPPRSYYSTLAARMGKKIHYIPIGQLSPQSIKKIRVFHILSTPAVRKYASEYIW